MLRAEGGAKIFGVFLVKNHHFTPKKSYFFQLRREGRTFWGYFVWKITILRQKIIFFPILGGGARRVRSPGSAPGSWDRSLVGSTLKTYNIGIWYFSAKHAVLRGKSRDWLVRNQNNVSEWNEMSTRWLLFQWTSTIKIQLTTLV